MQKRFASDHHKPGERLIEFKNEEDCAGDRQRTDDKRRQGCGVCSRIREKPANKIIIQSNSTAKKRTGIELPRCERAGIVIASDHW